MSGTRVSWIEGAAVTMIGAFAALCIVLCWYWIQNADWLHMH